MGRPLKPLQLLTGNNISNNDLNALKSLEKGLNDDINNTLDFNNLEFLSYSAEEEFNNIFKALSSLNILNNADKPQLAEWCNLNYQIKELNRSIKEYPRKEDIKLKLDIIKTQNIIGNNLGFGITNKRAILNLIKEQNEELNGSNNISIKEKLKFLEV